MTQVASECFLIDRISKPSDLYLQHYIFPVNPTPPHELIGQSWEEKNQYKVSWKVHWQPSNNSFASVSTQLFQISNVMAFAI